MYVCTYVRTYVCTYIHNLCMCICMYVHLLTIVFLSPFPPLMHTITAASSCLPLLNFLSPPAALSLTLISPSHQTLPTPPTKPYQLLPPSPPTNPSHQPLQPNPTNSSHLPVLQTCNNSSYLPLSPAPPSMLRCYLIVVFQARPMELWDMDTLSLLKVLHSIQVIFPIVVRKGSGVQLRRGACCPVVWRVVLGCALLVAVCFVL